MCGITCKICDSDCDTLKDSQVLQRIKNRGPDSMETTEIRVNGRNITFTGSVLWMQGSQPTIQPVENNIGILLYNGDIYDEQWSCERSDTEQIKEKLDEAAIKSTENIIKELKCFKGPFSIVYFDKQKCDLLFTRDKIGRNSLLLYKIANNLIISSVLGRCYECIEIPATHIYVLNIITNRIKLFSWESAMEMDLEISINDWVNSIRSLQALPDEEYSLKGHVTWDMDDKDNIVYFMEEVAKKSTNKLDVFKNILSNSILKETMLEILKKLDNSVAIRLKRQPKKCKNCLNSHTPCNHSAVGILFSGGLDCTILAFIADKYVEKQQSIDLINVAFKKDDKNSYEVPDRITGKQSLEELEKICPNRKWIFHEINVPKDKLLDHQETDIADLVFPRQTVLDESLGSALWFAAQGNAEDSQSPCRVLLLGSGADELFGGYTRHRNAFKRHGWAGLSKELLLDWKRISFRNLARDNRVICDHGRQPRLPYLDEDFTDFVLNLKPWFRCFPSDSMGPGVGDKLFLRLVAYYLGLEHTSVLPKRALQFGSRIANKKEKGSDISTNFLKYVSIN